MEIDLNKEESTETSIFISFSIREYVAEIRKKNPVKCWPFGSLRDPDNKVASSYQSPGSTILSGQNCPSNINSSDDTTELTDAPNLSKAVYNGSSELTSCKVNNGKTRHEINNVDEGAKIRHNEAADNIEPGRNRQRRKPKKFRLLSDIDKDPASVLRVRCERTKIKNVNRRFVAEIEDGSDDDVTLAAYFSMQKGVEMTDSTLNKKRGIIAVEEPSVDQDKKSNYRSKDSIGKDSNIDPSRKKSRTDDIDAQTMPEHEKDFGLQCSQKSNQFTEVSSKEATEKEKEAEDSEMEAVMLLARHFNEQKQILHTLETHPTCACVKKKIREHTTHSGKKSITNTSSKTATKRRVKKIINKKLENAFCSVQRMSFIQNHVEMNMMKVAGVCSFNRNPADFSTPIGENKFMRGG